MKRKVARKRKGGALVELASIAWLFPVAIMLSLNAALAGFAAWINDAACRDLARSAAQQSTSTKAKAAAERAIKAFATQNNYCQAPRALLSSPDFVFETFPDQNGKPQLDKGPFVKVATEMEIRLPVPVLFANDGFDSKLKFKQSYTYPLMYPGEEAVPVDANYASNTAPPAAPEILPSIE